MEYYYLTDGRKEGPFSLEELKNQNIQKDTLVWHEGLKTWTEAKKVDLLKSIFIITPPPVPPPPLPKKQIIDNTGSSENNEKNVSRKSNAFLNTYLYPLYNNKKYLNIFLFSLIIISSCMVERRGNFYEFIKTGIIHGSIEFLLS